MTSLWVCFSLTWFFKKPHVQKSQGVRSDERGDQTIRKERLKIRLSVNIFCNACWASLWKWEDKILHKNGVPVIMTLLHIWDHKRCQQVLIPFRSDGTNFQPYCFSQKTNCSIMNVAVKPHYTVTFAACKVT